MCIFINCIRKNLDDRGEGQSFYRKVSEYMLILFVVLHFYLVVNMLFKDYLRSKPSYRLLGTMLLFQAAYASDLFMQEYQENLIHGPYTQLQNTFPQEHKFECLYKIMWLQNVFSNCTRIFIVTLSWGLQVAIFLDLYLVLRDPFSPRERRLKYLYQIPLALTVIAIVEYNFSPYQDSINMRFLLMCVVSRIIILILLLMIGKKLSM